MTVFYKKHLERNAEIIMVLTNIWVKVDSRQDQIWYVSFQ